MSGQKVKDNILYSNSWGETLKLQKSALRWDIKRAMKGLCAKLSELGEECFVVTANVSNGWVGHIGTIRGDEFMDDRSQILYDFLNYCCESQGERKDDAEDPDVSDESTDEADLSAEIDDSPLPIKISNAYTLSQYEGPETDSLTDNIVQCMPFRESKDTDVKDSDSQKGADLKTVHEPKLECLEEFQYSPSPTRSKDSRDNPEPDSLYMDTDTNDSATEMIDKCDMEDTDSVPERNSTSMSEKCVGTSPESS